MGTSLNSCELEYDDSGGKLKKDSHIKRTQDFC
jgi:hypothetical protein